MQINVSPHHMEFSSVFVNLILIYIVYRMVGLHYLAAFLIGKSRTLEKQQKQCIANVLQIIVTGN